MTTLASYDITFNKCVDGSAVGSVRMLSESRWKVRTGTCMLVNYGLEQRMGTCSNLSCGSSVRRVSPVTGSGVKMVGFVRF